MTHPPGTVDGIGIEPPSGWRRADPIDGVLISLVADGPGGEPVATAVVTREDVPLGGHDLARWSDATRRMLAERLPRLQLVDHEETVVAGRPARRLLAHYPAAPRGGSVLEQWLVPDTDRGIVLSCTTTALDYDDATATTFAALAASITLREGS